MGNPANSGYILSQLAALSSRSAASRNFETLDTNSSLTPLKKDVLCLAAIIVNVRTQIVGFQQD
jgi:hypothetical protein